MTFQSVNTRHVNFLIIIQFNKLSYTETTSYISPVHFQDLNSYHTLALAISISVGRLDRFKWNRARSRAKRSQVDNQSIER